MCNLPGYTVRVVSSKWNRKLTILIPEDPISRENLEKLLKILKRKLGTGGFTRDGSIYLQGDQSKRLCQVLQAYFS